MYIEIAAFVVLIFVYLITLCQLKSSMKQLDEIEKERNSVMKQFILFIVAYISQTVFYVIELSYNKYAFW